MKVAMPSAVNPTVSIASTVVIVNLLQLLRNYYNM